MKKHLIRIEAENGSTESVSIYGDCPSRPFSIANNLWNYVTPWHAGQCLEKLAKSWEAHGHTVRRIFGLPKDMPTKGSAFNVAMTLRDYGEG